MPVVWYVQPYAGGAGIGRYHRGQHLAREWRSRGIETHVFCGANHHLLDAPRAPDSTLDTDAGRFHFVGLPSYDGNGVRRVANMAAFGVALRRHVARARPPTPDIVVYSSPHLFGVRATRRLAARLGARFVFEVRDLWPQSLIELGDRGVRHPLVLWLSLLERDACRRADAVVSLLPNAFGHLGARGLDEDRWCYIPNGIDPSNAWAASPGAPPSATDADESDELVAWANERRRSGRRVLVYAGALGVPNAVHTLLESVRALPRRARDRLQVLLVGAGTETDALGALAEGLPCRLHEQVPKARLWRVLAAADGGFISLRPSPVFRHGVSPNKLFDYLSASLPVISAIDAGNDPVAEAGAGWSVAPGDVPALATALEAFVDEPAGELAARGVSGRRWVTANHAYGELAARYADLFARVLGRETAVAGRSEPA